MIYIAIRDCFYGNTLFKTGDKIDYSRDIVPCPKCEEAAKKGKLCLYCKGTKRAEPPHHFRLENETPTEIKINTEEVEKTEIDDLREELKGLGGAFDMRWGMNRLRQSIITLRREQGK